MAASDRYFMVDERLLGEIVGFAGLCPQDVVLEVGAGSGNLTEYIAEKCKVIALEKEHDLVGRLRKRFDSNTNVDVIECDALKYVFPPHNKIVSNIPYSISRKLVERFITGGFELAVLVVQREFAEKLCANPGHPNYRMLSALTQSTCSAEILCDIPPEAFEPRPDVTSSVIRLRQSWRPPSAYIPFLNSLFSQKNKKIRNILKDPGQFSQLKPLDLPPEGFKSLFERI